MGDMSGSDTVNFREHVTMSLCHAVPLTFWYSATNVLSIPSR